MLHSGRQECLVYKNESRVGAAKAAPFRGAPNNLVESSVKIRGKRILDIQILHIQRILFDKLPPRLHVFAHQRGREIRAGQAPTAAPNVFSLN